MKATAQYNFDPRSLANDALGNTLNATSTANTTTGLSRDELFVGLSGGFGNIRLGSPNSIGLNAWQPSSSLGTGIGSGYTGGGRAGTMTNSFVQTRYNRSVRYDSPVMGGLQVAVLYAAGNDQPAVTAAQQIPNNRQATEIGLRYAAGPLTLAYANVAQGAQTNATGWYSSATLVNAKSTYANVYSASYTMGATTLHAGMNDGNRLAAGTGGVAVDSKGSNIGITHNIGAIGLMALQAVALVQLAPARRRILARARHRRRHENPGHRQRGPARGRAPCFVTSPGSHHGRAEARKRRRLLPMMPAMSASA